MAGNVSDEAFARYVNQIGIVTLDKLEAAKALQEENARKGTPLSLADVLVRQGVIPQDIRENIQKKIQAEEQGAMRQLGPYKLLKKLGEGGMGAVYLAEDTMAGRKVAVKVLPQKYSDEREFLTRFRREAQATGKLNHANIVTAYNVGEDSGTHYYAMEYCAGDTLDRILKREEYLPWDEAIAVTIQVARGLQHAHDHGIIHRDIKPANIFICSPLGSAGVPPAIGSAGVPPAIGSAGVSPAPSDAGGTPALPEGFIAKILDLGLSKNIGSNEQSYLTQTGAALGTPHYISPEQARGDKSIDGRTDIYSLGATLYHLVTGQTPFTGTTAGVVIAKHLSEQLPNPQDIRGDLPDGVVQVLQKMMAKDVADRYRDCGELLADLELLTQGRMPALAVVDAALSTIATPRRGAQAKATKPRVPRFGAAVVRKKAEPVPLEPLAETVVRKDAAVPHSAGLRKPRFGRKQYIAIGAAAVVLLGLIAALAFNRSETQNPKSEGNSETETAKSDAGIQPDPGTGKLEPAVAQAEALPKELSLDLGGGVKMDMVLIPAGEFMMDSRKQGGNLVKPGHKVQISQPFYIGKYDVTVAQFRAFADATKFRTDAETSNMGSTVKDGKSQELPGVNWRNPGFKQDDNHPACVVTWHDAQEFCKWATANHRDTETQRKWTVRLPTETEWQYAASGPQSLMYPWGDKWEGIRANVADASLRRLGFDMKNGGVQEDDGYPFTSPCGAFKNASWCGACDMVGNVWQWCQDCLDDKFFGDSPVVADVDPQGPGSGAKVAMRGGSWAEGCISGFPIRFVWSGSGAAHVRGANHGFRVVVLCGAPRTEAPTLPAAPIPKPETPPAPPPADVAAYAKEHGLEPAMSLDLGGGIKLEVVLIPAGKFLMGSPQTEKDRDKNETQHEVTISQPYYMGKYLVTVAQFRRFVEMTKYQTDCEKAGNKAWGLDNGWKELANVNWKQPNFPQEENHPVCLISWNDARAFCKWANEVAQLAKLRYAVRLPTEAQWEYACRAKTTTRFYTGNQDNDLDRAGWFNGNSGGKTHPVGQKVPNAWGLYDMHGNVWDWCEDRAQKDYYEESPPADPAGPMAGDHRVLRGGCWGSDHWDCRSAHREWRTQGDRTTFVGFRLAVLAELK